MIIDKFDNNHLILKAKLTGEAFSKLSNLPGYSKWEGRSLRFRPVSASIAYLLEHFPEAEWLPEAMPYVTHHKDLLASAKDTRRDKHKSVAALKKGQGIAKFKFKTAPYNHQLKAFLLSRDKSEFALFMDQGTGKTKIIIDTAAYLHHHSEIDALVVIAPKGVHEAWVKFEIPAHMPEWVDYKCWAYTPNTAKYRLRQMEEVLAFQGLQIITINVEGFTSPNAQNLLTRIMDNNKTLLVIDESSRIRTPGAKRTKFLIKAGKNAAYKRILSGTPVTNGMENLYSQLSFLDHNIIGLDTYTTFKRRYCVVHKLDTFREIIVGYQNQEELIEKVDGISFRVLKEDCLDLPPKVYKRFPVHLTYKQAGLYNSLIEEYTSDMDGLEMTAELAVTRLLRLQQIICNWYMADGAKEPIPIEPINPRLTALATILRDIEGKAIVWARFVKDLDAIAEMLGPQAIRYHGNVKDVEKFQENNKFKYFIANAATAGLGLTLTAAETVVYYSNDFDLEHRLQSEDRTHRIGTTGTVTYIDIEAAGTIDTKIITALREKKLISDAVLQDPGGFFMEYEDE